MFSCSTRVALEIVLIVGEEYPGHGFLSQIPLLSCQGWLSFTFPVVTRSTIFTFGEFCAGRCGATSIATIKLSCTSLCLRPDSVFPFPTLKAFLMTRVDREHRRWTHGLPPNYRSN